MSAPEKSTQSLPMGPVTHVLTGVADLYGIRLAALIGRKQSRELSWRRQVAVYLARELTGQSCAMIGRVAGGRSVATVRQSINRVKETISTSSLKCAEVQRLRAALDTDELAVLGSEAITGPYRDELVKSLRRTISECRETLRRLGAEDTHVAP